MTESYAVVRRFAVCLMSVLYAGGMAAYGDIVIEEEQTTVISDASSVPQGSNITNRGGNLFIDADGPIRLGTFRQSQGRYEDDTYFWSAVTIADSPVSAVDICLDKYINKEQWYFTSVPMDVRMKDITTDDEDGVFVWKEYDGHARARFDGNPWKTMTSEMTLKAGKGYILRGFNWDIYPMMLTMWGKGAGSTILAHEDVRTHLDCWPSDLDVAASWNLVANPYPCFLDSDYILHDGPVIVYRDGRYRAMSLEDDHLVFYAFEAFFVQRIFNDHIVFPAAGRLASLDDTRSRVNKGKNACGDKNEDRQVIDFILIDAEGNESEDFSRLVVNPEASSGYDPRRDAVKFDDPDMTCSFELFVNDKGTRLAIDERPVDGEEVSLGLCIAKEGDYVLMAKSRNPVDIVLTDRHNGKKFNLSTGPYSFRSSAGEFPNRFSLTFECASSVGVDAVNVKPESTEQIYGVDGVYVGNDRSVLPGGVYVVATGGKREKILIHD